MYKEIIIVIVVIALIIGLDIITNNYTEASVSILSDELNILREDILQEDKENAQTQMMNIKNIWEEKYNILAYYIEHDELEKVETELTSLGAFLNVEEYRECISELDKTIFVLEHIEEKEKFDVRSIF